MYEFEAIRVASSSSVWAGAYNTLTDITDRYKIYPKIYTVWFILRYVSNYVHHITQHNRYTVWHIFVRPSFISLFNPHEAITYPCFSLVDYFRSLRSIQEILWNHVQSLFIHVINYSMQWTSFSRSVRPAANESMRQSYSKAVETWWCRNWAFNRAGWELNSRSKIW